MIEYKIKGLTFATNDDGSGLFIWDKHPYTNSWEYHQILGTCEFDVSKVKDPRAKIIRQLRSGNFFGSWSTGAIRNAFGECFI